MYAIHHSSLNCIAQYAPVDLFVCLDVKKDELTPVKQTLWISNENIQGCSLYMYMFVSE